MRQTERRNGKMVWRKEGGTLLVVDERKIEFFCSYVCCPQEFSFTQEFSFIDCNSCGQQTSLRT